MEEEVLPQEPLHRSMPGSSTQPLVPHRPQVASPESAVRRSADKKLFHREYQTGIDSKGVPLAERYRKLRRIRNLTGNIVCKEKAPAGSNSFGVFE
jgi:hypothetical protein